MQTISEVTRKYLDALKVVPDEEFDRMEREDRAARTGEILGKLPYFLRTPTPSTILGRVVESRFRDVARTWLPERGTLVLLGPTRAGKSSAAAYAFRRLVGIGVRDGGAAWRRACRLQWFAATELERARLEHPLGRGDAPEIIAASRASVLVVDDIGWDRDPTAVSSVLAARYESELPTIVTSGLDRAGLTKRYGAAVVRRLCEAGGRGAQVVDVHGEKTR